MRRYTVLLIFTTSFVVDAFNLHHRCFYVNMMVKIKFKLVITYCY
ncbi:hypothetical protein [Citrobacter phage vB_CfrS_K1M]